MLRQERSWSVVGHQSRTPMLVLLAAIFVGILPRAEACGLEHVIGGVPLISHPGALGVAVAVADARRNGLLLTASPDEASNDVRLQRIVADLQRLRSRLAEGSTALAAETSARFSLMLVGPGLWSEFVLAPADVLAEYHTDGPAAGQVVVLTHPVVLRALLQGTLNADQAADLGLIAFSGSDSGHVRQAFDMGFRATSSSPAGKT